MSYVDFFCLPLKKSKESEYVALAAKFAAVMQKHGLLHFCEAIADDVPKGKVTDFFRAVAATEEETVVAAFYIWPDKKTRDKAWEEGMKDPSISHDPGAMPFDGMRMFWGGFRPLVES